MQMIDNSIIEKLSEITQEEMEFLQGAKAIDRKLYMETKSDVINSRKLLGEGKLITIRPHTRFIHFPCHTHDYIEIVYMCRGKTIHIVNGTRIELRAGELLFLGKNAKHEILKAEREDIGVNFIILPHFFDTPLAMLKDEESPLTALILTSLNNTDETGGYLHFRVSNIPTIQNLIENLLHTIISKTPNKQKINQTTMGLLLLHLVNHTDKLAYENAEDALIGNVLRYIEENYREGTLSDMAKVIGYDFFRLSREIKRNTGKTYTELVQEKRLAKAAFLLKNTEMKVSDISVSVGYENESYFHRIFTMRFGKTPKKFRDCK